MDPISYPSRSPQPPQRHRTGVPTIIAAFVLLLIIAYVMSVNAKHSSLSHKSIPITHDAVTAHATDLTNTVGNARLPAGFPVDIPVNTKNIVQSTSIVYTAKGVTQDSISFTSSSTIPVLYTQYLTYMAKNGYSFRGSASSSPVTSISGSTAKTDLSVVLSTVAKASFVQISYVAHQ